jgi:porin
LELGYAADLFKPVRGGLSRDPVALDNLDLLLHLSLNPLLGLRGTSIRVHVQSNRGSPVTSEVGSLQGVSNLEAPREWRLYEAWVAHQFGSPRLSILAGIYDVNSEFDVLPGAGDFLNSSFGFGPEYDHGGPEGPSTYPATGLAMRLRWEPSTNLYGLLGVSDGVPGDQGHGRFSLSDEEGALVSMEVGYARPLLDVATASAETVQPWGRGRRAAAQGVTVGRPIVRGVRRQIGRGRQIVDVSAKLAFGGWAYTKRLDPWNPDDSGRRSWGLYLLAEKLLAHEADASGSLSGFARAGVAANGVNQVSLAAAGGLVYRGLLPGRPDDTAGLGLAYARNGDPFLELHRLEGHTLEDTETVFEFTYRAELGSAFLFQPNLQWIQNPGMEPDVGDALVLGLRLHLLLEHPGSE